MPVTSVIKDPQALTMTVIADFSVSRERLWQAYSDPRQLEKFWGEAAPGDSIVVTVDGVDPGTDGGTDATGGNGGTQTTGGAQDELAVTGATLAVGTLFGGAFLLVIGFGLVLMARTRGRVTA